MFLEPPRDVFLRDVWINRFCEDDLEDLIALMGADHMLLDSDLPHSEGMTELSIGSSRSLTSIRREMWLK